MNDNKPQVEEIPNTEHSGLAHDQVINPISPDLQTTDPTVQNIDDTPKPKFDVSSIYPTPGALHAGSGGQSTATFTMASVQAAPRNASNVVPTILFILGAWTALSSFSSLLRGSQLASGSGLQSTLGIVSFGLSILFIFIGIGLALRKEFARISYIVLSFASLVLSAYSIYGYIQYMHAASTSQSSSYAARIASDQQAIDRYSNNSSLPVSIRQQQDIQTAEQDIANTKAHQSQAQTASGSFIIVLALSSLFTVAAIVFLILPNVRTFFS